VAVGVGVSVSDRGVAVAVLVAVAGKTSSSVVVEVAVGLEKKLPHAEMNTIKIKLNRIFFFVMQISYYFLAQYHTSIQPVWVMINESLNFLLFP
jgi:hypothetical protein